MDQQIFKKILEKYGCKLSDEQIAEAVKSLDEIAKVILDFEKNKGREIKDKNNN